MPSPEHGGPHPGEPSHREQEHEPVPYHRAARFADERRSARTYRSVQDALFAAACDLSAYRVLINRVPHVAVVGEPPPADLDRRLDHLLAAGEPVALPDAVLTTLAARRAQAARLGPWIEGHHRPGTPL